MRPGTMRGLWSAAVIGLAAVGCKTHDDRHPSARQEDVRYYQQLGQAGGGTAPPRPATQRSGAAHDHDHDHHGHAHGPAEDRHAGMWASVTDAVAVLVPTHGQTARGVIRFMQHGGKVHVLGEIEGLSPNGTHGFHIHEFGDASAPDGTSAGGHFNPEGKPHAGPDARERHAGDLGNVKADASGKARVDLTVDNISVAGLKNPVIGRGLVLHAKADDLKTQPTGDAGGRIAVGVIGVAKSGAGSAAMTRPTERY